MLYFARGSESDSLSAEDLRAGLYEALDRLGTRSRVLAVPPDFTRFHSRAGELTRYAYKYYGENLTDILPAIGTHFPMSDSEIEQMFGEVPHELFRAHDWREGLVTLGEVPAEYVREQSGGAVDFAWPAQVGELVATGGFDLILSIGQVVPHEVIGMANYNKNLFVGTGGAEGIGKSHFLGAAYGMERIMGRADNPVRRVLNYASDHFATELPVIYVQTVVGPAKDGKLATRGMYIGDDVECFHRAAELSLKVNFTMVEREIEKAVVYLDPAEFKSTWLGNKSIYRTRMALADGAELIVLAPGVREFGEDPGIDTLIRKYGYCGTERVLELVREQEDLAASLGAAAHLIHGSSEGRFSITYCPGKLSREDIEKACFRWGDLEQMMKRYDPGKLRTGWNEVEGEEVFFVPNPAIGLWAHTSRFREE
jgi:nickel-dependent lactate racemase